MIRYSRRFDVQFDTLPILERSTFGWHVSIPRREHKVKSLGLTAWKISFRITARRWP